MPWILLHQTWQIYPQSIKHRCLEYHYTKLGRSIGRSTPNQLSIDALNTATPNLADLPPSMEHRCLEYLLHQTWQIYWQIYPPSIEHRCLEYWYTKLGRSTPSQLSIDALNTTTLNLADTGRSTPHQWTLDALKLLHQTWQILPAINQA